MPTQNILKIGRVILASSLSLLPLAISSTAYAGNTHNVSVQVTGLLELETLTPTKTDTFDGTVTTGEMSVDLGAVRVRSNQKNGFKVQVSSGGALTDGTDTLSYTLTSSSTTGGTGETLTPTATAADFYTSDTFKNQNCAPNNGSNGCDISVILKYNAGDAASLPFATYSDTITYTVLAQ